MLNPLRVLGSAIILLLCVSGYQTYQNAADCRFFGQSYSMFRGCVGGHRPHKRTGMLPERGRLTAAHAETAVDPGHSPV